MNRSERSIFLFFIEMCRYNVCKERRILCGCGGFG